MLHFLLSPAWWFESLSHNLSLGWFAFLGSFIEEVVSPIPSLAVLGIAGTLAQVQGKALWIVWWLAFVSSAGKLIGTLLYYRLGDVLEDVFVPRFGKYWGITHEQVERVGRRFMGHWTDGVVLGVLRLIPFMPNVLISVVCGIIKMRLWTYMLATFLGNFFKDVLYLSIWYIGLTTLREVFEETHHLGVWVSGAIVGGILAGGGVWWWKYRCRRHC